MLSKQQIQKDTEGSADGQTRRRLKRIAIVVFENLLAYHFFKVHYFLLFND